MFRKRHLFFAALVSALLLAVGSIANAALVAHWDFDDGSGSVAQDSTANDYDGALQNTPTWITTGLPNVPSGTTAALSFNGTDEYVVANGPGGSNAYTGVTGTNPRSMSAWIQTNKSAAAILNWGVNSGGQKWTFRTDGGKIRMEVSGGFQVGNTNVLSTTEWHHVAAVLQPAGTPNVDQIRLYVDGVLEGISATQGTNITTAATQNVRIGRNYNNAYYMNGSMDEVRIYDHGLSSAEVRALAGVAPDTYSDTVLADNPTAYWRLGEDTGAKAFNEGSIGSAVDSTYGGLGTGAYGRTSLVATSTNTAVNFDGTDNRVDIPDNSQINTGGPYSEKTIETWFDYDANTGRRVIFEQGGTGNGLNQYVRNDSGNYYLYYGAWESEGTARSHFPDRVQINSGQTYHAVSVYDAPNDTFLQYLDGAPVSGKVDTTIEDIGSASGDAAIGAKRDATKFDSGNSSGNGNYFDGRIDDVSLYNNALTLRQVQTHYEAGTGNRLGITDRATLGVALNYDAKLDSDGNDSWEDTIGSRTNAAAVNQFDWALSSGVTPVSVASSQFPYLSDAYEFAGTETATTTAFGAVAGDPSRFSASFEIVFKPEDIDNGAQILFETGGGTGSSFTLLDETLTWQVQGGGTATISTDITSLVDDFIQAIGVIDIDTDTAYLYLNGGLVSSFTAGSDITDWSGTDGAGLGSQGQDNLGGFGGGFDHGGNIYGTFQGQIALFRFYPGVLSADDVRANFQALTIPEPSTFLLAALGLLSLVGLRRTRRDR